MVQRNATNHGGRLDLIASKVPFLTGLGHFLSTKTAMREHVIRTKQRIHLDEMEFVDDITATAENKRRATRRSRRCSQEATRCAEKWAPFNAIPCQPIHPYTIGNRI